jgi:hypothetical protein
MCDANYVIGHKWGWAFARLRCSYSKYGTIVVWSKRDFAELFEKFGTKESAHDPYVLEQLQELHNEGRIEFVGSDDVYFKILKDLIDIEEKWVLTFGFLNRSYYDCGSGVVWSKKWFIEIFENFGPKESAYDPYVLEQLQKLHDEGKIEFVGSDDVYFKILKDLID